MRRYIIVALAILLTPLTWAADAQAWITSPSGNRLMEEQAAQAYVTTSPGGQVLTLNPATEYQTVDGFGWMLTEGSAKLLKGMHSKLRAEILTELYSLTDGRGANIVRIAIGACDLSESDYTYSPAKDETLSNFSLAGPDADYVLPVLKEILAINPDIKIMAVPWTAPIWMKTNNGYTGGSLKTEYYRTYAQYFVKYLQAMQAEGIRIWAITPQNEPLHGGNNPSMVFDQQQEYTFVDSYLGPELENAGFGNVKIIGYDHNCDNIDFPMWVARSRFCSGSAFHLYGGSISALKTVHDKTGKDVYFTEQYTGANGDFGGDFNWHMQNVMIGSMQNYSRCAIEWNLASDAGWNPHTSGGCSDCKGALTIGAGKITSRNVSYYIVSQMSRVVRDGAKRIGTTGASDFKSVAFHNPDGSLAVVAYNTSGGQRKFTIALNGQYLSYTVPANAAVSVLMPEAADPFDTAVPNVTVPDLDETAPTYNLMGQRVTNEYKGIVIQNGHKYLK